MTRPEWDLHGATEHPVGDLDIRTHRNLAVGDQVWVDEPYEGGEIVGFTNDGETIRARVLITYQQGSSRIDYRGVPQVVNISELARVA